MNTCSVVRSSRQEGLFSLGLFEGLQVRLRLPRLREAPAGIGLERLATAFSNNPGWQDAEKVRHPPLSLFSVLQYDSPTGAAP